jgi:ribonuclease Y
MRILAYTLTEFSALFVAGLAGFGASYCLYRWKEKHLRTSLDNEKRSILENARRESESIAREAKIEANETIVKIRRETELEFAGRHREMAAMEQRLDQRDALINRQLEGLVAQEKSLQEQRDTLKSKEVQVAIERDKLAEQALHCHERLVQLAHMSEAEARALLFKEVEREALRDAADLTRHIMENARMHADDQAQRIVCLAIQRYAGEHSFETTTAAISLPNEEIKGRIIGREGRNIRAFEAITGVTVLIDDTPNAVVLSSFDPVRREIAREAMQRLILDGRIHPTRIEEVVSKVSQEIDDAIQHAGEDAVFKAGLPPMQIEIVKLLGRLRFRYSFSQNILDHAVEVAHLTGMIAAELGIDVAHAKRAGLLHDIGKAVNHEIEGAHAIVGADFLRRHGESEEVVNGVASHHGDVPATSLIGSIVSAADAISASRPGARSETMTTYIKRLENLEKIGSSFQGVEKCFAVQAGRELRVFVHPEQIDDEHAFIMARGVARKIEEDLQYPGQIRITVIRETRCVEFAK